jgi:hypothetical protein
MQQEGKFEWREGANSWGAYRKEKWSFCFEKKGCHSM